MWLGQHTAVIQSVKVHLFFPLPFQGWRTGTHSNAQIHQFHESPTRQFIMKVSNLLQFQHLGSKKMGNLNIGIQLHEPFNLQNLSFSSSWDRLHWCSSRTQTSSPEQLNQWFVLQQQSFYRGQCVDKLTTENTIALLNPACFSPLTLQGQKAAQGLLAQTLFVFLGPCITTIYHLWFPAALMVPAPERVPSAAMPSLSEHLQKQNQSTCSTWNPCGAITLLRDTLPYPVFPAPGLHCGIVPAHSFPLSAPPGHST